MKRSLLVRASRGARKTIGIAELKTHLSRYLRLVRKGERIVVMDRSEPVAEIIPHEGRAEDPWRRLAHEGKVKLGTQDWANVKIGALDRVIDVQKILDEIREDTL